VPLPKGYRIYIVGNGQDNARKLLNLFKKSLKLKGVYIGGVGTGNYPGVKAARTLLPPGVYYGPINFHTYDTEKHHRLKMFPDFLIYKTMVDNDVPYIIALSMVKDKIDKEEFDKRSTGEGF
jgi:hypothetical protein